jgi:hypothetical protein
MRYIKTNYSDKYGRTNKKSTKVKVNNINLYKLTLTDKYYISKKSKDTSLVDHDRNLLKSYLKKDVLDEMEYYNVKRLLY